MKKLLIFLCLLIASPAFATYYTRTDCGTIVGPVEGDVCTQTTTVSGRTSGHLYIYRSAAWVDVDSAGTGAPTDTTYITQTPDGGLSNEQALSTLATGILKNTTTTGVLSIASPGTDYVAPTGSGAGLTALNASQLTTGTAAAARLGSGTPDTTTFLRGDNTWTTVTVGSLSANGANCSAGNASLGVDAAGAVEGCFDVATQAELNTHGALTGTGAHGATTTNTASQIVARDGSGNFAAGVITATLTGNVTGNLTGNAATATTANALTANGANCAAGEASVGVDASGAAEGCVDVATQAEVDALTHGQLGELGDDDHAAIYVKFEATAGVPAAGSCDREGQIQQNTTPGSERTYSCYSTGGNPIDIGTQSDGYPQITGDSGSITAVGPDTMKFSGGTGLTMTCADGAPDTCTMEIDSNAITFAKMQAITDGRLLGASGGTAVEEITPGTGLTLAANTLSVTNPTAVDRVTGNQTVNNSETPVSTTLTLTIGASEVWFIDYDIYYTSSTVADIQFDLTGPTSVGGVVSFYCPAAGSTVNVSQYAQTVAADTTNTACGGNGATVANVRIKATVVNSTNAGTITLRFAQNTSEVSDTVVLPGSSMVARRE